MSTVRDAKDFDLISNEYDATREPLEAPTLEALVRTLKGWGVQRLLEVGVGTGRIAAPLGASGLEVTGVDASLGMLGVARAKGVPRLVRGTAYRLPFPAGAFDVAFFVHVLHVLEDPVRAIGEGCRVSRQGTAALVRPDREARTGTDDRPSARRLVIEHLRAEGVELPERARGGPPARERELVAQFPPQRLVVLSEEDVTEPMAEQLAMFSRRASRWTLQVPPEKLARAVEEARKEVGDRTHTYHRVRALALWERAPQRAAAPAQGAPPVELRG